MAFDDKNTSNSQNHTIGTGMMIKQINN
jgi:hypothetical protein